MNAWSRKRRPCPEAQISNLRFEISELQATISHNSSFQPQPPRRVRVFGLLPNHCSRLAARELRAQEERRPSGLGEASMMTDADLGSNGLKELNRTL